MQVIQKHKKYLVIPLICSILLSLTGCWDKLEVEESAFVAVIGIDKLESDRMEVTYQISNPQGGGFSNVTGSSQNEPPSETITIKGADVLSMRDLLGASVTRQVTFAQTKVLVISEDMAKSDLLLPSLEGFLRDRQIRMDMFMIISKEKASEFIRSNKPLLETRPHKFYEFMSQRWKETALVPLSNIHNFIMRTQGKESLFINIYGTAQKSQPKENAFEDEYKPGEINKEGGNNVQIIGSAIFKEGKMIGTLNGEETRLSQILRPNFKIASLLSTLPDPVDNRYRISGRVVKNKKTEVNTEIMGDYIKIDVKIPIMFDLLAIPSGIDYVTDLNKQKQLQNYISSALSEKAMKLVKRTQSEFKGEPFMWDTVARKKFKTWNEYEKYDYISKYPKAQVTVKYDVTIRRMGKQLKPIDANMIRGGSHD